VTFGNPNASSGLYPFGDKGGKPLLVVIGVPIGDP
jgi:hypothetical protein